MILHVWLQLYKAYLQVECAVVHGSRQMVSWKPWAYYMVVLLVRGLFRDPGFERILAAAFSAHGRRLELVTVLADSHFDFPNLDMVGPSASVSPTLKDEKAEREGERSASMDSPRSRLLAEALCIEPFLGIRSVIFSSSPCLQKSLHATT